MNRFIFAVLLLLGLHSTAGAEGYLDEARNYLDKGEVKAAVIQLKNLLRDNPLDAEGRLLLGETYLKLGDGASAAKELEKARDLNLPEERWIESLSRALLLKGDTATLIDEITPSPSTSAEVQGDVEALKGMAYLSRGDKEKALSKFESALELNPKSTEAVLGKARIAFQEKTFDTVETLANSILENNPDHVGALLMLGESERLRGNFDAALSRFNRILELNRDSLQARLARATTLIAKNEINSAKKDLQFLKKQYGELPFVEYLAAVIAFQEKEFQKADDALTKVLNVAPNHPQSLLLMGTVAYAQGKLESAESNLSKYLRIAPGHAPSVKLLAATRIKLGQPGKAVEILLTIENKSQNDPQYLAILGNALMQNNELDKGLEMLEKASVLAPDVAAIQTQLALGHLASGEMEQAVGNLENAVNLDQGIVQADVMLVMALVQQKKFDEALKVLDKLSVKMDDSPVPHFLRGGTYKAMGERDKAVSEWRKAQAIKPDYASAALNLARFFVEDGDFDAAEKEYQKLLQHSPDNLAALVGMAQLAEKRSDLFTMENWLLKAREKNPEALQPALMLSRYYLSRNEPLKALEGLRDVQSRDPDNLRALFELGKVQLAAGQNSNAIHAFERLKESASKNPELFFLLGKGYQAEKDLVKAEAGFKKSVDISSEYLPSRAALAELYLFQKRFDETEKEAKAIQNDFPESALGYRFEGDVHRARKEFDLALKAYAKGYEIAPDRFLAQHQYLLLKQKNKSLEAIKLIEKWLEKTPDDYGSLMMLAMGLQEAGEKSRATKTYEKLLMAFPKNLIALNNLAWLYQELGDKKAVETAEKALALADDKPEILDTVGWILIRNNQVNKGLVLLQQAAVQAPHIPAIRVHLAEALAKAGRKDEAVKELNRLLKEKKRFVERVEAEKLLQSLN